MHCDDNCSRFSKIPIKIYYFNETASIIDADDPIFDLSVLNSHFLLHARIVFDRKSLQKQIKPINYD